MSNINYAKGREDLSAGPALGQFQMVVMNRTLLLPLIGIPRVTALIHGK
jgi:hypothetical protein